jgi:SAM-dependent methyltransferase
MVALHDPAERARRARFRRVAGIIDPGPIDVRLNWLTLHWERLARRDPFAAVLTDVDRRFGGRDLEGFYRSGTEEIAAVLHRATERGLDVPRRRALDFGCGVGRLTHALAERFERSDGVDISPSMLRVARERCRQPERCTFHRNLAPNLEIFPDAAFSFIYSTIVLQHIDASISTRYIREFVRVLASDGLLVFQLPSHRTVREPSAADVRTAVTGPLPDGAFSARITAESSSLSLRAGERQMLRVTVENRSRDVWPALPDVRGRYQINLANRWLDAAGALLQRDDERCPLPIDLAPGASADLLIGIRPLRVNGRYLVELDLVQENVGWFAEHGSPPLRIPGDVIGGDGGPPLEPIVTPTEAAAAPRFSERHPRLFVTLRATGIRDAYWSVRRGIDRLKSRRDAMIRRRLHPAINWWQGVSFDAKMDMHCVPRAEVLALLEESGGRVVAVEDESVAGGYLSCRYWVVKR